MLPSMSTSGSRGARSGSRTPQSAADLGSAAGAVEASVSWSTPVSSSFLPRFFAPLEPLAGALGAALEATAARRAATTSLAYAFWPSLAPFSMGPDEC